MILPTITVKIEGRDYPLSWGNMARRMRFPSIPYDQRRLAGPSFLVQLVWAAYAGGIQHPYSTWEHLASVVAEMSDAEVAALDSAMSSVMPPPPDVKANSDKTTPVVEPSDAEKKSDSLLNGHSPAAVSD